MLIGAWRKGKRCQVGGAISPGHVSRCHFAARRYFAKHLFMLFWTARVPPERADRRGQDLQAPVAARSGTARAFEAAIAPLREEGMAAVTVRDDPSHGMLAAVQISAPAGASREAIVKRCGELLGGSRSATPSVFLTRCGIEVAYPPVADDMRSLIPACRPGGSLPGTCRNPGLEPSGTAL
jgi:hypothetical protein